MATLVKDLTSSVMTGVSTIGNKALGAFGINQATLSGAIDIVVIKHPPGSRPRCFDPNYESNVISDPEKYPVDDLSDDIDENSEYFICSPFHVRFGKLQLLRSNEVNVSITINGKNVDNLQMKLGQSGEAYFVVPTNKPLQHKKLLTSPLITPLSSTTKHTDTQKERVLRNSDLQRLNENSNLTIPNSPIAEERVIHENNANNNSSNIQRTVPPLNLQTSFVDAPALGMEKSDIECSSEQQNHQKKDEHHHHHHNSMNVAEALSPTLSAASSFLEDREVLSRLNIDTSTGTDNDSLTGTDNESNLESLDGGDLFGTFSATHVMIEHIGMSLCAHKLKPDSEENNMKMFEEHKISYAEFCENPSLCFDTNLIILYKKQLFPAKIAFPQIFSLLSFGSALSSKAIKKLNKENKKKVDEQKLNNEEEDNENNADYNWYFSWFRKKRIQKKKQRKLQKKLLESKEENDGIDGNGIFDIRSKGVLLSNGKMGYFRKSLRPSSDMLKTLPLNEGDNTITFTVSSTLQGTQSISASIFLWNYDTKIVISDVDGTITKSDVMGHVAPFIVGSHWSHNGVARLFTNVQFNGYRMLYLTSRGIGQSAVTRSYLFENVKQRNFSLPMGPIIMTPDSLLDAFYREVIKKRPQEFKIPALANIASLFAANHNPFYAGFGNRKTDCLSYDAVGVPKNRIFIIQPNGQIHTNNKLFTTSYDALNVDVESMFKNQCNPQSQEREEFNSFNYWNDSYYANLSLEELTDLESNHNNESDLDKDKDKDKDEDEMKVKMKNNQEEKPKDEDNKETSLKILMEPVDSSSD